MLLGTETLEDHCEIRKKIRSVWEAFHLYGGKGVSASSLHRESTDFLINFLSRLSLDFSAQRDDITCTYVVCATRTYSYAYCACELKRKLSCDVYVQSRLINGVGLNGNRRDGPGSGFLKVRHYHTIQKAHHARK